MTFDCADATAQARFWALALGYVRSPPPEGWETWEAFLADQGVPPDEWSDGAAIRDPAGVQPAISFLTVPERKQAKNRLHLDLKVSGGRHVDTDERTERIDAKVTELVAAGAHVHEHHVIQGHLDHVVMLDPEDNEFCVV
ncbi:VOC family protein [Haloechinothrix sp. YIM 98757]|uniref:VOC family protein n=2 Tax=Haloechinothrix aidingensis TaxID=2752311 RepID=A0A838A5N2_9PSEU|nr:VOC family protein [Haloechinothrix aidingensis]